MNADRSVLMAACGHVFLGCLLQMAAPWFVLPVLLEEDYHGR